MDQTKAPLFETLYEYSQKEYTSFDVPGHKQGKYINRFNRLFNQTIRMDVNSMPELDLLSLPNGIIKQAQDLMADAFNFDHSYFLINGTTGGIMTMIYSAVKKGEKILVPRNVHKSIISGIIISGAIPIFIEPEFDEEFMILNQISLVDVKRELKLHPDIKAVLLINPTYFGILSDIDEIIDYLNTKNIISLVDQAHGAHFNFYPELKFKSKPDLVAISTHKTLGSLSQSSVLLHNEGKISSERVLKCLSMFHSTSASYLLMASLDEMRRDLVINRQQDFIIVKDLVSKTKDKINALDKISVIDEGYTNLRIDPLKIVVKVNELGLSGFDVYKILKKEYGIQLELAETYTILAIISIADDSSTLEKLYEALKDISMKHKDEKPFIVNFAKHQKLELKMLPSDAFNSEKEKVDINDALNRISTNTIMIYPPGIPMCMPGEVIDQSVIDLLKYYNKETIFTISETQDNKIEVVKDDNEF